jgi:ribosomal-protein-alanine N-acetyltransferase
MGNRGRFGKYGDHKRIKRLRDAGIRSVFPPRAMPESTRLTESYKKKISRKTPRISIRPATPLDVSYVGALSKKAFQKYGPYETILPRWLESGITSSFIAIIEERPVGFAMLGRPSQKSNFFGMLELLAVAVEPANRGLGIGDLLMREVERTASKQEVEKVILHTAVKNIAGRGLFNKHGFKPLKVKKNFYPEGQDALLMCKDLILSPL